MGGLRKQNKKNLTHITSCVYFESEKMGNKTLLFNFLIENISQLSQSLEMVNCLNSQGLWNGDLIVDKSDSRLRTMIFQNIAEAMKSEANTAKLLRAWQHMEWRDPLTYNSIESKLSLPVRKALDRDRSPLTWSEFLFANILILYNTVDHSPFSIVQPLIWKGILTDNDRPGLSGNTVTELWNKIVTIIVEKDHAVEFLNVLRTDEKYAFTELCKKMPSYLKEELAGESIAKEMYDNLYR